MTTTLRLTRTFAGMTDRKRTWQILLDDIPVGAIAPKAILELPIEPGRHTLLLTSTGKRRSPQHTFDAADGTTWGDPVTADTLILGSCEIREKEVQRHGKAVSVLRGVPR